MKKETWIFTSYMNEDDYENKSPYFVKIFHDHTKLKVFSAHHDFKEKKKYPDYVSAYVKLKAE